MSSFTFGTQQRIQYEDGRLAIVDKLEVDVRARHATQRIVLTRFVAIGMRPRSATMMHGMSLRSQIAYARRAQNAECAEN